MHAPRPRAMARVLVAFVVLAGLFLMHGLAGGNCGGQGDGSASSMTPAVTAASPIAMMATDMAVYAPAVPPFRSGFEGAAVSPAAAATGAGMAGAVVVFSGPKFSGTTVPCGGGAGRA